ncbi:hypothetical protein C0075_02555 [Rhizobium sp. KAs_5_22]|nr:hypothetical protein C0075_02555 [Rhizobium sp. KAs_5_22]
MEEHDSGGVGACRAPPAMPIEVMGRPAWGDGTAPIGIATVPWRDRWRDYLDFGARGLAATAARAGRRARTSRRTAACLKRVDWIGQRAKDRLEPGNARDTAEGARFGVTSRDGRCSFMSAMIADPVAHIMCLIPMFHHPLRHARSSIRNKARVRPQT